MSQSDSEDEAARPAHWFKPGQSGNPSGPRKKASEALAYDVLDVFGSGSHVQIGDKSENLATMEHMFLSIAQQAIKGSNKHLKIMIETLLAIKPARGKRTIEETTADDKWAREELARKLRIDPIPDPPSRLPKEVRDAIRNRKRRAKLIFQQRKRERSKEK